MNRRFFFFLLPLFAATMLRAQTNAAPPLQFDRIPSELGLSQNLISAIMQDRKGFLWVGTKDGLNRFDGYKFTVYRHDPFDSTSLSDSYVTALLEDRAGRIWVGTFSGGLNLFERATETFYRVAPNRLNHPNVTALAEDESRGREAIWVATLGGIVRLKLPAPTLKNDRSASAQTLAGATYTSFAHAPNDATSLGSNLIYKIAVDQSGTVWAATQAGIYRTMPAAEDENYVVRRLGSEVPDAQWRAWLAKSNRLYSFNLCKGQNGRVWIGNELGQLCWNEAANEFIAYDSITDVPRGPRVMFEEDRKGILWYTGNLSLWRFDWRARTRQQFKHDPNDPGSIAESSIMSLCEDSAGVLWFGSNGNGLYKYDPRAMPFSRRQNQNRKDFEDGKLSLWRGTSIRALCETGDGTVWLGAALGDLLRLNRVTGEVARVVLMLPNRERAKFVFSMLQDRKGTLWLGSEYGLLQMEWREGKLRLLSLYEPEPHDPIGSRADCVYKIFEDRAGEIWFATNTQFFHLNQGDGSLTPYRFSTEDPRAVLEHAYPFIHQDRRGCFWLGTKDGLHRFDPQSGSFQRYRNQPQDLSSLSHNVVRAICEDPFEPEKIFWLGTAGGGLNRFDLTTEKFTHFTLQDGLPDMVIYAIFGDREGNLWMSTNHGLSRFNPRTNAFKNFDVKDGLQDNEFNSCAYFKSAKGELFFGGIGGFNAFYPEDIQDNPHAPPVVITDFQIFNQSVSFKSPNAVLEKAISETSEITLSHAHNVFSFEFAALDYGAPAKNRYAYKMENFDRDWQPAGTKRTATYTNLDPGEYVFRVKAANNDGVWNEEGAAIKITITPPWWRTWWAYALYALFLAGALYTLRRYERNQQQLKHQIEIERLQTEKHYLETAKLQELDHLKSRFFANLSHEFRTPLTLIMGQIEGLRELSAEKPFKAKLDMAFRHAQQLLHLINQLLDLSKLEAGRMELRAMHGNIVPLLKNLTYAFEALALKKRITLRFQTTAEEIKLYHEPDKLEKIMHNLLSNAFKFTPEGGSVLVRVEMIHEGRGEKGEERGAKGDGRSVIGEERPSPFTLQISVRDTGIGIPKQHLPHIFDRFYQVDSSNTRAHEGTGIGLALTKELVELHGGQISATSEEGFGTTFVVRLPMSVASDQLSVSSGQSSDSSIEPPESSIQHSSTPSIQQSSDPSIQEQPLVLVVEDNADLRSYLREHLEERFQIVEAADGEEGLAKALELVPDLVITDIMMPKLDGYGLSRKLRSDEKTSHVPIIMLTARAEEADKIAGLEIGVDDYLTKPFSPNELRVRVRNLIEQRQRLRERFSQTKLLKPSEIMVTPVDQKFLERLKEIMEANMEEEDFDVKELSAKAGMSDRQLERKLKALIGQTPNQFIRSMRLQRAKQLLEQNAGTVSEIAFRLGFNNLSHFSKNFREAFGVLPSEVKGEG